VRVVYVLGDEDGEDRRLAFIQAEDMLAMLRELDESLRQTIKYSENRFDVSAARRARDALHKHASEHDVRIW